MAVWLFKGQARPTARQPFSVSEAEQFFLPHSRKFTSLGKLPSGTREEGEVLTKNGHQDPTSRAQGRRVCPHQPCMSQRGQGERRGRLLQDMVGMEDWGLGRAEA